MYSSSCVSRESGGAAGWRRGRKLLSCKGAAEAKNCTVQASLYYGRLLSNLVGRQSISIYSGNGWAPLLFHFVFSLLLYASPRRWIKTLPPPRRGTLRLFICVCVFLSVVSDCREFYKREKERGDALSECLYSIAAATTGWRKVATWGTTTTTTMRYTYSYKGATGWTKHLCVRVSYLSFSFWKVISFWNWEREREKIKDKFVASVVAALLPALYTLSS